MFRALLLVTFCLGVTAALSAAPARAAEPDLDAANAAADYIITLQQPDGGFPGFEGSSPGSTLDALFALLAAGRSPLPLYDKGPSPIDYLSVQAEEYATDPGAAAKLALSVALVERETGPELADPRDFGGVDLLATMAASVDAQTGAYGLDVFDEALYVLAQIAAGEPAPVATGQHLRSLQLADGGWEFADGAGSDTNTTSLVLQAILALPNAPDDPNVGAGLQYLLDAQHDDGGFGFIPGEESDPHSTAFVIQALIAAHEDIDAGGVWAQRGAPPLEALVAFQNPATGAFQFFGEDSPFSTFQAVPGVMLAPFPLLETRPDSVAPVDTPTMAPVATPTPLPSLPPSGGGHADDGAALLTLAALLAGAGAIAAGAGLARRSRR